MFHAISALLLFDGKEFSKHKAVISHFGHYYVKSGKAPKEFHKAIMDAFEMRQSADYDYDALVSRKDAEKIRRDAKQIIEFVEKYVSISQKSN